MLAVEADGGRSASAVIYQGLTRNEAPTIDAHFPTELTPGAPATTFTVAMHNPSDKPVPATRLDFTFFPGTSAPPVLASQLHLSYSTTGPTGPFIPIALVGDTKNGDDIEGYPGPQQGATLDPHASVTLTFHLSADTSVPAEAKGHALVAIEAYFDQINSASGSGTTLDDSYASDLHVTH
jgi:hypothetical protein